MGTWLGDRRKRMPFFGSGKGDDDGTGSPLMTGVLAGGLGYLIGSNSTQPQQPYAYPPQQQYSQPANPGAAIAAWRSSSCWASFMRRAR